MGRGASTPEGEQVLMGRVSITPAQVRAIAVWTRCGGDHGRITIDTAPSGTVLVRRGPASHAFIGPGGGFESVEATQDRSPAAEDAEPAADRFAFIRKGARVRVWITARSAVEVAASGANARHRQVGERLLRAMKNADKLVPFRAVVAIPAPEDQAGDPTAPVCLLVPDLEDSGELVVVNQEEVEPTMRPAIADQ